MTWSASDALVKLAKYNDEANQTECDALSANVSHFTNNLLLWDAYAKGPVPIFQDGCSVSDKIEQGELKAYLDKFTNFLRLESWKMIQTSKAEEFERPFELEIIDNLEDSQGHTVFHVVMDAKVLLSNEIMVQDLLVLSSTFPNFSAHASKTRADSPPHALAEIIAIENFSGPDLPVSFLLRTGYTHQQRKKKYGNDFNRTLNNADNIFGVRVFNLTTVSREYAALRGLNYSGLKQDVLAGTPAPKLEFSSSETTSVVTKYGLNDKQAEALLKAKNSSGFSLIQGPPGTGKTKTVLSILEELLSQQNYGKKKRILVCAPSNAGIEEIVTRIREAKLAGTSDDSLDLSMVRMGRPEMIHHDNYAVSLQGQAYKQIGIKGYDKSLPKRIKDIQARLKTLILRERRTLHFQDKQKVQVEINETQAQLNSLRDRLASHKMVVKKKLQALIVAEKQIVLGANIVCTTLSGAAHKLLQELRMEFDTVIIDEAAQSTEPAILIPLKYGCKRCILIGDPKQLPPTVFSQLAVDKGFGVSLFERMDNAYPDRTVMLNTQFRMHPHIAQFPSKEFYGGKLITHPSNEPRTSKAWHNRDNFKPYRFFQVSSQHTKCSRTGSITNREEALAVFEMFDKIMQVRGFKNLKNKVGIISPYKLQVELLKEIFEQKLDIRYYYEEDEDEEVEEYEPTGLELYKRDQRRRVKLLEYIDFKTVDGYQGQEKEIIIMSCVRANPSPNDPSIGFLSDMRRLNVAITRAKSALWIFGHEPTLSRDPVWNKMLVLAKSGNMYEGIDSAVENSPYENAFMVKFKQLSLENEKKKKKNKKKKKRAGQGQMQAVAGAV